MLFSKSKEDEIPKALKKMKEESIKIENKNISNSVNNRMNNKYNLKTKNINKTKNNNVEDNHNNKVHKLKNSNNGKYSQNNASKIKTRKKVIIKRVIISIIAIIILGFGIWFGVSSYKWKNLVTDMFVNENSVVKDTDGNIIATLGSERKKEKISFSEMPDNLKNAYVAIEDERFYSHHGVDIKRTGSAILSYIFNFGSSSFGGSTITQQLVKNLTGDNTDSVIRKVKEWGKAYELEWYFSKDEILELYLNVIYVGPNIYGVQTGAKYYFSKDATDLSLAECAFLAGINNAPNSYNPFGDADNSEKIENRTKTVLSKMLELEYINQEEYSSAVEEVENGLNFKEGSIESEDGIYSYHTDALINEIISDISEEKNITTDFATNYIYLSGLTINSTQNSNIQNVTEKEFQKKTYQVMSENGTDTSQSAMVIIDQSNGQVISCVGGLGEKDTARGLNRATQSVRQTGSAIKPLAVLAPALDKKIITPASIYDDTQKVFEDNYSPENYDGYLGEVTVRRALESSQNIPFVEIMEELKPKNSIKYLEKMGISTLTDKDNNLSLALGGLEKGISPLEMASAYATIANGGTYIEPTFYTTIVNRLGKTVLESNLKEKRVISQNVAYVLSELLTQPVQGANGTATYCSISGMDVAAKTGTTDENYDRWLCGFTPYYTAVTWFGYDQNETVYYNNQNPAGLIWASVMKSIHSNLEGKRFEKPSGVTEATICAETGKLANTGCPNTYTEYFVWGTVPGTCDIHEGQKITNNNKATNSDSYTEKSNNNSSNSNNAPNDNVNQNTNNENLNNMNVNTSANTNISSNTNTNLNTNTNTNTNVNNNSNINTTNSVSNTNSNSNANTNTSNDGGTNIQNTTTNTNSSTNVNDSTNSSSSVIN